MRRPVAIGCSRRRSGRRCEPPRSSSETKTSRHRSQLAAVLDEYISARAGEEGVSYALSPGFFEEGLSNGVHVFFGVETDGRRMLRDLREPQDSSFEEWCCEHGYGSHQIKSIN